MDIKKIRKISLTGSAIFLFGIAVLSSVHNYKPKIVETGSGQNWGLGFGEEGTKPTGNKTVEEMSKYDAYFMDPTEEKVIYLTFDAGYENGNTEPILNALKKHNAKATFLTIVISPLFLQLTFYQQNNQIQYFYLL